MMTRKRSGDPAPGLGPALDDVPGYPQVRNLVMAAYRASSFIAVTSVEAEHTRSQLRLMAVHALAQNAETGRCWDFALRERLALSALDSGYAVRQLVRQAGRGHFLGRDLMLGALEKCDRAIPRLAYALSMSFERDEDGQPVRRKKNGE